MGKTFLDLGAWSPIFRHQKMPKVPIFRCPKIGLRVPEAKNGDHLFTPTSPQNGGLDIGFMCLPLLEKHTLVIKDMNCSYFLIRLSINSSKCWDWWHKYWYWLSCYTSESDHQERSAKREMGPRMMTNQMSPSSGLIWKGALEMMIKEKSLVWFGYYYGLWSDVEYCQKQSPDSYFGMLENYLWV